PKLQARAAADISGAVWSRFHALHDAVLGDQILEQGSVVLHERLVEPLHDLQGLGWPGFHGSLLYLAVYYAWVEKECAEARPAGIDRESGVLCRRFAGWMPCRKPCVRCASPARSFSTASSRRRGDLPRRRRLKSVPKFPRIASGWCCSIW